MIHTERILSMLCEDEKEGMEISGIGTFRFHNGQWMILREQSVAEFEAQISPNARNDFRRKIILKLITKLTDYIDVLGSDL